MTASQPVPDDNLQEAVGRILNPERLLPGEDPDTTDLEEAERWLAAYDELLGFKHDVVGEAEAKSDELSEVVQPEAQADLALLHAERERLERRYDFWRSRVKELAAG